MRIDEVLRKENIGKRFKGMNDEWEVIETFDYVYDITMKNNEGDYIDSWNLLYEIVNENFIEVKEN